jgi:single-strand DNA-binding protein
VSRSLNKAILIGNVGSDPEIRSIGTGSRVAQFSLATSRTWNDQAGTKQEKTEWHRCVVWNSGRGQTGVVEVVEKYVKKGDKIYVEGEIEYRQWQDKDGQTRYTTEIKVRDLMLLGGRGGGTGDEMDAAPRRASAPAQSRPKAAASPAAGGDEFNDFPGALEDEDDDLPF